MPKVSTSQVLLRIRAEYLEMPGLSLTREQLQRLCGVEPLACEAAIERLVESGFLSMRPDGSYGRFGSSDISRARPAKAGLGSSAAVKSSRVSARAV
jgi:hypothetical protein